MSQEAKKNDVCELHQKQYEYVVITDEKPGQLLCSECQSSSQCSLAVSFLMYSNQLTARIDNEKSILESKIVKYRSVVERGRIRGQEQLTNQCSDGIKKMEIIQSLLQTTSTDFQNWENVLILLNDSKLTQLLLRIQIKFLILLKSSALQFERQVLENIVEELDRDMGQFTLDDDDDDTDFD